VSCGREEIVPYVPERDPTLFPPFSIRTPLPPSTTYPQSSPGRILSKMMSILWSHSFMSSQQGPPLPPLLSPGIWVLLLCFCGHALSIPTEHPTRLAQEPLGTTLREGLDAKVLILGAGVAGITAAQKLESYGISDFLIVEAHHEVGGRLKSRPFGSPDHLHPSPPTTSQSSDTLRSIEVGAQWIQGYHEQNPIWGLAKKYGVKTRLSDFSGSISESPFRATR